MRPAITLLTMLATVLHFTVGCCLHASHAEAAAICCHDDHPECHVDGCGDDHGHEHSHAAPEAEALTWDAQAHRFAVAAAPAHACEGCTCVATVEAKPASDWTPGSICPRGAFEAESIAMLQAARGPCEAAACPVPADLRPPLFERLTV